MGHRIKKYLIPCGLGGNDDGDGDEAFIVFLYVAKVSDKLY
jgi:hypothetical protein